MTWQLSSLLRDLRMVRSKDVAQWYGQVVVAWDSLQPTRPGSEPTYWRNLGYWTDSTRTLDEACRGLANRLADAAEVRAGHDVLDVGCGLGESTMLLADRLRGDDAGESRLVGLDLTAEHIAGARARGHGDTPEFVVASAVDLPFPAASFDRVLALECAFHFPDRTEFFAQAHRVLRPGGVLGMADVLVSPGFARTLRASDRVVPRRARDALHTLAADMLKMPTENLIDLASYLGQLRRAGFTVRSVEDISARVFPYFARHWRQAQDPVAQEKLLRATGLDARAARDSARAWRRQMAVLKMGWQTSRFVIVTAELSRRNVGAAPDTIGEVTGA